MRSVEETQMKVWVEIQREECAEVQLEVQLEVCQVIQEKEERVERQCKAWVEVQQEELVERGWQAWAERQQGEEDWVETPSEGRHLKTTDASNA
jgi:hypothetical protein